MCIDDLSDVVNLYTEANQFTTKKHILSWTKKELKDYANLQYVATHQGKIIGAVSATQKNTILHIEDLAVLKNYRMRGVGSLLLKHLFQVATKQSCRSAQIWVHWKNANAIPFYYKNKFAIVGYKKTKNIDDVPDGEDIILMKRILSS